MLEAAEQIERFKEYFETEEKNIILETASAGRTSITVDFVKLSSYDPALAIDLLEHPEDTLKAAEQSIKETELPTAAKKLKVRIINLPEAATVSIRNLRVKNLSTFVSVQGIIHQKSTVRPKAVSTRYECPQCGNPINKIQEGETIKEPRSCSCGRKGNFRLIEKEQVDFQVLIIEEALEDVPSGDKGDRIIALLKEDLTLPSEQTRYILGSKAIVNGILETIAKQSKSGISVQSEIALVVNSIETSETLFEDIKISKEEEEEFKELSQNPNLMGLLRDAIAPTIWGHNEVKRALTLQLFGGVKKKLSDNSKRRGLIHILLCGDPGAAKSKLLERMKQIHPKSRMATMTSSTGKGLTAAVVKDEFLGGWSCEAGPIVLANGGMCMIDEVGSMEKEDHAGLHECMESETIRVDKANIHEILPASTSILAAGNPKFGRFDVYGSIGEQIGLSPPLMSRFDLVFAMRDVPDPRNDKEAAEFMISVHQMGISTSEIDNPFYNLEKFRHYIAYAIKNIKPKLTDDAANYIKEVYISMRQKGKDQQIIGLTARNFEGLIRLSEAAARTRLSQTVEVADAQIAIQLSEFCWRQLGYNPETGLVEVDKIDTGITSSGRAKRFMLLELIPKGSSVIEETEVIRDMEAKGVPALEVEELIGKLKREGYIYEPKPGRITRL